MHTEISESFWLGIEVVCTVVLLIVTLNISATNRQLNNVIEQQNATAAILQDVREWKAYDGTTGLYEADVLSVYYKYGSSNVPTPKSIIINGVEVKGMAENDVILLVSADKTYKSSIVRDNTGVVANVVFTEEVH